MVLDGLEALVLLVPVVAVTYPEDGKDQSFSELIQDLVIVFLLSPVL